MRLEDLLCSSKEVGLNVIHIFCNLHMTSYIDVIVCISMYSCSIFLPFFFSFLKCTYDDYSILLLLKWRL